MAKNKKITIDFVRWSAMSLFNNSNMKTNKATFLTAISTIIVFTMLSCRDKASGIAFSTMEKAERELVHRYFPEDKPVDELPFDHNVFDYDLFEQVVKSDASSMNYPFDSLQYYAKIQIIDAPDGNVRYYTWDYPHEYAMSDFHTITQYRWDGKVFCQKPEENEDDWCELSPNSLYVLEGNTCNYYLTTSYFRESSNIGFVRFEISKLTKNGLQSVDFWDASYEYYIADWYFMTNGEGFPWLDYFDEATATLYVPEVDGLYLIDRYWCYKWNGYDMKPVGTETFANPHLHSSLSEYRNLELFMRTSRNIIRVDRMADGSYRYAAWDASQNMASNPELVIAGGSFDGESFVFHNKGYNYLVDNNSVKVVKDGKTVGCWEKE